MVNAHENIRYSPAIGVPNGKFNLRNQFSFLHHRSGWNYVLRLLSKEHNDEGVKFDGSLDTTFGTEGEQNKRIRVIPYREPWVGVFHNPPMTPAIFTENAGASIISKPEFQESLCMCKGIYVLSDYHARFLRSLIKNVPIEVLYHPTEFPETTFNFIAFGENKDKKVVNIGWWLRKVTSIYRLAADPSIFQKIRLLPSTKNQSNTTIDRIVDIERGCLFPTSERDMESAITIRHMPDEDYDRLLSQNVVFLDLYDASASNVVIECMARATPLLVNPLPAVMEYLGPAYPMYYLTLNEASQKLHNIDVVRAAHEYLLRWDGIDKIRGHVFMAKLREGEIYKSL